MTIERESETRQVRRFDGGVEKQRVERLRLARSHLDVVLVLDSYDAIGETFGASVEHVLLRLARFLVRRVLERALAKLPVRDRTAE